MCSNRHGLTRTLVALVSLLLLVVSTHSRPRSAQLEAASSGAHSRGLTEQPRFTHISVIGERNSGTNFIRILLQNNLAPNLTVLERVTQHKHYMQDPLPVKAPHHLLVVCVRNPYDWVLAMRTRCYCCDLREREDFWKFVSLPYNATEYSPTSPHCMNPDMDISNGGRPFKNLMDMRAQKIQNHISLGRNWMGGFALVRLEDVLTKEASIRWLMSFANDFHLVLKPTPSCSDGSPLCIAKSKDAKLEAVEGDARGWVSPKPSGAPSRAAASLYLNRDKFNLPHTQYYQQRDKVSIINALLVRSVEALVGYEVMEVTYPPEDYKVVQT